MTYRRWITAGLVVVAGCGGSSNREPATDTSTTHTGPVATGAIDSWSELRWTAKRAEAYVAEQMTAEGPRVDGSARDYRVNSMECKVYEDFVGCELEHSGEGPDAVDFPMGQADPPVRYLYYSPARSGR